MENNTSTASTPKPLRRAPWVAEILSISVSEVYTMAREGTLPSVPLGPRKVRFDEDAIIAFARKRAVPANGDGGRPS